MRSILDLPVAHKNLSSSARKRFDSLFSFSLSTGKLVVPESMKQWVVKQFSTVSAVETQPILMVTNNWTYEGSLFNGLRANRPMHLGEMPDRAGLLAMAAKEPFAQVERNTPEDTFGRIRGKHEVTASNVAKYDALHGLVVFDNPDPLAFTETDTASHYATAMAWIAAAREADPEALYPAIGWNCLWKAGASLVHGHMQVLLGRQPYAAMRQLRDVQAAYRTEHAQDYFVSWFKVHDALGLGSNKGSLSVFASLTPKKEKEAVILSAKADRSHFQAIFRVLDAFRTLGVSSFNAVTLLPPLDGSWKGPAVTRIVDRGNLAAKTTDWALAEMYLNQSVVSSDPFKVWKEVKKHL